ncbi:FAD-dependent oxidoreductase [Sulfuriferula sp. AH1]|uniref:FAD-dependent oxidoreductase n=1 Tax=Sulfuriferula sp. AH1 TaxID=1985873 RepID=UPI000B3B80B1|nr:FAD-dependent oxidoreductase [Sulfuriferula sp. AH1]ARU30285.1 FAD-dependent oxidoreductase [Sulfuriferula sp. AH1]
MHPIIIIGSGMAAYTLAREFRKLDKETALTIVTADDGDAYSKPMLSTALAQNKAPDQLVNARVESMREQLDAQILTHRQVLAIDATAKQVQLQDQTLVYSQLVLALGADPVRPQLAGDATDAVLSVNDLSDYARFRAAIVNAKRVAILGGGLIGCEFANDLATAGYQVDIVHPQAYPLERLLPEAAATALRDGLAKLGVTWHLQRMAVAVDHHGDNLIVSLNDGSSIETDAVLSAIGLRPRTQLAQNAGIHAGRGIRVNRQLQTNVPGIYAIGDCAEVEGHVLPYVLPLMAQARALAVTLSGTPTSVAYPAMPVVVKTPACPIAVAAPSVPDSATWAVDCQEDGICALYQDANGQLLGFALTGKATQQRQTLAKQLPPILAMQ